jgi:hypothetical protein
MHDESTGRGAPWSWQNAVTSKLGPEASTANFPTVYGADVTMTTVGDPQVLSVEATPFHKVVRHASQFLVSGRCPISHVGEGRQGSQ